MAPRKHWVLMIDDNRGVRPSTHNGQGLSPLQKAEAVLAALPWKHLKPLQRDILLARAAAAPGEFRLTGENRHQDAITYWFELREV